MRHPRRKLSSMSATLTLPAPVDQLDRLVTGVRAAVDRHADWSHTARFVADQLRAHLPGPDVLTPEQRLGSPDGQASHTLHVEPDGSFSIIAVVWRPGQVTPIHDHTTWCVFGVIQGVEHEDVFDADLNLIGQSDNRRRRRQRLRPARRHPPGPQHGRGDRHLRPHLRDRRDAHRLQRPPLLRLSPAQQVGARGALSGDRQLGDLRTGDRGGMARADPDRADGRQHREGGAGPQRRLEAGGDARRACRGARTSEKTALPIAIAKTAPKRWAM